MRGAGANLPCRKRCRCYRSGIQGWLQFWPLPNSLHKKDGSSAIFATGIVVGKVIAVAGVASDAKSSDLSSKSLQRSDYGGSARLGAALQWAKPQTTLAQQPGCMNRGLALSIGAK